MRAACQVDMPLQEMPQLLGIGASDASLDEYRLTIDVRRQLRFGIVDKCEAVGHAGSEVASSWPQDHNCAPGHVLATVVSCTLDDGHRAAVAHRESFSRLPGQEEIATGCSIEDRVPCDHLRRRELRRMQRSHCDRA